MIIVDRRKEYQAKELKHRMQIEGFYNFVRDSKSHLERYKNGLIFQSKLKARKELK